MTTLTTERLVAQKARPRLNQWDSPWLNSKFVTGMLMVLGVVLMGLLGPLFWDVKQARAASSPLNLPPFWVQPDEAVAAETTEKESTSTGLMPNLEDLREDDEEETSRVRTKLRGTLAHPLGTENSGRDMLALIITGAPSSLRVGFIAAGLGMIVGIALGFSAGFLGGWVDNVIRTLSDAAITIPSLAVLIVIGAFLKTVDVNTMALLLALFAWPGPTRLIRSQVLSLRERGYVQMARLSGVPTFDIMFKEMMPNMLPYLAASLVGNISGAILAATSLEALGLGPSRVPTLGMTIFYAIRASAVLRGMWWWWGFPIVALVIIFMALFLIATGLDEIANPRLRGAHA